MSTSPLTISLCVPYCDQQDAIRAGARYSDAAGYFVAPTDYLDSVWQWLPLMYKYPDKPALLPEMLPVDSWERNLRLKVSDSQWDAIRRHSYALVGYRCGICGNKGRPSLECHEHWEFDDLWCVQTMTGLLSLCPLCHKAHHLGIARRLGMYDEVTQHIMKINRWNHAQLEDAVTHAKRVADERNRYGWAVDLSWLSTSDFRQIAERATDRFR